MISILFGTGGAEDDLSMLEMLSMMSCGAGRRGVNAVAIMNGVACPAMFFQIVAYS